MIPQVVRIRVHGASRRPIRLWLPVVPFLILLSPLLLLTLLVLGVVGLATRTNLFRHFAAICRLLAATRGTHVEIEQDTEQILVSID